MSLPMNIAAKAEEIVNSLTQTDYQHKDNIDPATGVYDCDCNGFVGFVLTKHGAKPSGPRPQGIQSAATARLRVFHLLRVLDPEFSRRLEESRSAQGRQSGRHRRLAVSRPSKPHTDTGHVVILAEAPKLAASGDFFTVRVYDSAHRSAFRRHKEAGREPVADRGHGRRFGDPQFQSRRRRTAARLSLRAAARLAHASLMRLLAARRQPAWLRAVRRNRLSK